NRPSPRDTTLQRCYVSTVTRNQGNYTRRLADLHRVADAIDKLLVHFPLFVGEYAPLVYFQIDSKLLQPSPKRIIRRRPRPNQNRFLQIPVFLHILQKPPIIHAYSMDEAIAIVEP